MKIRLILFASVAAAAVTSAAAGTLEMQPKETAPPTITQSEPWQLTISSPAWLSSINGTVGIRGLNANVDITLNDILEHLDMIIPIRAEAQKGPFGAYAEFWYIGLSTGSTVNGLVQSVDVLANETYFDGGLSWRLINQPRGSLAVAAGTHFFNLYERMTLHGRTHAITAASNQFVDNIADDLEAVLNNDISHSDFTAAVENEIESSIKNRIDDSLGGEQTHPKIPHGPLAGRIRHDVGQIVDHFVQVKLTALQARIDALHLQGEARRAAVNRIVNAATRQIANHLAYTLETKFNQSISKDDYWFDPYLGLYGRYNFNKTYYASVRGQIGGFGVGADLMWQVEGVLGLNLTRNIFTELGYRALGVQYENEGLSFDAITHGPEITTGITF